MTEWQGEGTTPDVLPRTQRRQTLVVSFSDPPAPFFTSPPVSLEIHDDSASHAGHRPESAGGGTHFRVEIVSESFEGMNTIKRHKAVYAVLAEQMEPAGTIHALSLSTKTPSD